MAYSNDLDKMTQRRKWKSVNSEEGRPRYRVVNNQLRRETEKAKEKWWDKQCTELEGMNKMGRTDLLNRSDKSNKKCPKEEEIDVKYM